MAPSFLFGQFLGGLTTAMFLFLIASGLSLVFGVMRVLNFAHGSFYMLGAYLAWQAVAWLTPLAGSFWLVNFAFSVYASPVALRFQVFPMFMSLSFGLCLLERIWKTAFDTTGSTINSVSLKMQIS